MQVPEVISPAGGRASASRAMLLLFGAVLLGLPLVGCGGAAPLAGGAQPEVDAVFAAYDRPDSPGCALGVIRDGELVYARGYGMASLEHAVPIGPDSVFRVGSVSKQFVGMIVLLLEERGALSLDDDVRRWVPELPDLGETITIAHLLHHTSGLRDYLEVMALAGYRDEDYYTARELLAMLARQRELNFPPGAEHLYSNTGYFLLGQVIERVSGKSLDAVAQELVFGPLGMSHTHFHDDHRRIVPHRASGYAPGPDGDGFVISMTTLPIVGDGGVFTSVGDLLAWDRNFYANRLGEGRPELIERWLLPGALADGTSTGYAAGIRVDAYRGLSVVAHAGSFVGFRAQMMRFPEQRLSVITLCNLATADPTRLARAVAEIYLGDRMGPAPAANPEPEPELTPGRAGEPERLLPLAELRPFEGRYVSPELRVTYTLQLRDGRLAAGLPGRPTWTLESAGDDRFRTQEQPVVIRFARNSRGDVSGFLLDAGRVRNLWFERVE